MAEWAADERELVRRCREGSEAAFAVLVRQHRPRLYSIAFRLTGDATTAEDVVQETFIAAFKGIETFEPKPSLSPWLNTICIRTASKAHVDRRKRPASLNAPVASTNGAHANGNGHGDGPAALGDGLVALDPTADPALAAEAAELRRAVTDAIAALPFQQRVAVTLRHVLGMEYADAALAMDIPLNTYKSHLLRGTRTLRETLAAQLEPATPTGVRVETDGAGGVGLESAFGARSGPRAP